MRKITPILITVFLLAPFLLQAQSDSTSVERISVNAIVRFQGADFTNFNQTAADLGYQTFEPQLFGIGGEFQFFERRTVQSLSFIWYEASNQTSPNASQKGAFFNQWEILLRSEYDLLRDDKWVLSPSLGWAFQWSRLGLSNRSEVNGVGQALDTEVQKITRFHVPMELSLNVQRHIHLGSNLNSLLLGVRGGYRLDLGDDEWKTDGVVPMSDDPGVGLRGWFFSLRVGFTGQK